MNITDIESALETGLLLTAKLAPFGALAGPAGAAVGDTVAQIAALGATLLQAVSDDAAVIGSGDLTRIRALQAKLQAANADLAAQIAAS